MGCGCGRPRTGGETVGYRVVLPDGVEVPPAGQAPFLTVVEAKAEIRVAGGGTIRRVVRNPGS